MTDQATPAKVRLTDGLGPMRDAALTELENTTNQTWLRHRKRWAALVRAQDAEIQRLQRALHEIAEEWAGAECGEPVHAQEAYAIGLAKRMYALAVEARTPSGDVVGPCVCGSWPGGRCLRCPVLPNVL